MTKTALTVTAVQAVLAFLSLIGVVDWSTETQAAFGLAVAAVLGAIHAWISPSVPFIGNKPDGPVE